MISKRKVTFSLEEPLCKMLDEYSEICGCSPALLCRTFVHHMLSTDLVVVLGKGDENLTEEQRTERLGKIRDIQKRAADFIGYYMKYGVPPIVVQLYEDDEWEEVKKKFNYRDTFDRANDKVD